MSSLQDQIAQLASHDAARINKPSKRDSYLFEPNHAAELDISDIHLLAIGGYDQLKELDSSFEDFESTLFTDPVKDLDRTSLNKSQVELLNTTLNRFLVKLSPHLPTRAAAKVLEWLIRKFRVHEFNIDATLIAFLPYHDSTSFSKILQLLNLPPASSSNKYSFLLPVKKSHQALQRSILLRAIKSDHEVLKLVSQSLPSALEVVSTHRPLSSFWTITLLEYIQQARKIQDGELTTLYASIRATLRNKSSKDAQYAARMVFVVLAQKMPLGDKLLTSLMVSMLKALKDDKKIDSEVDQILLTLFAIIDAQGVQIAHEDYAKRVLSIHDLGNRFLSYLDNYSVDKGIASLIPTLMAKVKDSDTAKSTLVTLLESPKLSKIVGQSICDVLIQHAQAEEYASLISLAYQRWGETFDNSIQKYQKTLDDAQRKQLFTALTNANSHGMHKTMDTGDNATTLFLSTNAADNTTRALAVTQLLDQIKAGQIDDKDFVQDTLIARLGDDVSSIITSLYTQPDIVLDHVSAEAILKAVDQSMNAKRVPSEVVLAHVSFLVNHFARRYSSKLILPVIWNQLLVTSKTLNSRKRLWQLIKEANIKEGALKGVAEPVVKILIQEEHKTVNDVIAQSLAKNMLEDHDVLFNLIRVDAAHNTRMLALLVSSHLLSQLSGEPKLKLSASVLENTSRSTLENSSVNELAVMNTEKVSSMLYKKPESETTIHSVVALALSVGISNITFKEISWLSKASREAHTFETEFCYAAYRLANAPTTLTSLATTLLRSIFTGLRDSSLAFLASIYTDRSQSGHIRNASIKHAEAFLQVSAHPKASVDYQTILPSLLIGLQDPVKDIRSGASHCIKLLSKSHCTTGNMYAFDKIYGESSKKIQYLGSDEVQEYCKVLNDESENFVNDGGYLTTYHSNILGRSKSDKKLSKQLRVSIICYLFSHVVGWQNLEARRILMESLADIWDANRLATLTPLIKSLLESQATDSEIKLVKNTEVEDKDKFVDGVFSSFSRSASKSLLNENDEIYTLFKKSLQNVEYTPYVLRCMQGGVFGVLDGNMKMEVSKLLMEIIEGPEIRLAQITSDALKGIALDEVTYTSLLQLTRTELGGASEAEPPTSKRSRTDKTPSEPSQNRLLTRLTSIFDWVGALSAELSPQPSAEALISTFETLAQVTEIHATVAGWSDNSEVDYVEQMCLSQLKDWSESIEDWSNLSQAIRIDTVVNVIRVSKNPQTFQQALLLISTLAKLAPDNVLHNVMPIFTFMGANILQRDDSFSFNVVQKTIEGVVPVVVDSLKNQAKDQESLMKASKPFLMTFTDASNHIPKHRRLLLFSFLVEVLDSIKYLSTILMLLVDKAANKVVKSSGDRQAPIILPLGIVTAFGPQEQLTSLERIVSEVSAFSKRLSGAPKQNIFLERPPDEKTKDQNSLWKRQSLALLFFVEQAFQITKIKMGVIKSISNDKVIESKLMSIINQLLLLGSEETSNDDLNRVAKTTLVEVLNVIPVTSFAKIVKELLDASNENVRLGALQVLSIRLKGVKDTHREQVSDAVISAAQLALNLLKSDNARLVDKELALGALKTIADSAVNGELSILSKSVSSVLDFANKSENPLAAFLLLESLTPKLQTRMIPQLKQIVQVSKKAVEDDRSGDGALNCIRSVVNNLPTFVGAYLQDIFGIVFNKSVIERYTEEIQTLLNALSRKVPSKDLINVLKNEWDNVIQTSSQDAVEAFLYLFKRGLHSADRSYIMDNHKKLFKMFLEVFDIRTIAKEKNMDVVLVEDSAIEAFAEMVVKINESTFRPVFKRLYDWAVIDLAEDATKKDAFDARRITFYRIYNSLLDSLKAIIAPYTAISYDHTLFLLDESASKLSVSSATLWEAAIDMVAKSVKMDRGTFWTEERIVKVSDKLVAQIKIQPSMTKAGARGDVASNAVVEAANASRTDSSLRKVNGGVLLNMRDDSALVKVVALETAQALWKAIPDRMIGFIAETVSSFITECLEDSDERVINNAKKLLKQIEGETGESLESYLLLDKLKFQHGLRLNRDSICPRMDLLLMYNKQSTKLYRVNGSLIWERDLAIQQFKWNFDGKFIVAVDKNDSVHVLDVTDGSTVHHFSCEEGCSVDAFKVEKPKRDGTNFDYLPTLGALPDVSKSINQFLPFRLPKNDKNDGDYIQKLTKSGFPAVPIESSSVAIHVREESLLDSSSSVVACRYDDFLQLYLQGTLQLPRIPLPNASPYDSLIITPQLDVYTLTHYGRIIIPRDIHHLGCLSSQMSITLSYAFEGILRLTKLYADNGGPRSESIKWHDKIHEFVKPHSTDTPELALIQLLLMGTTSKGLREFIGENLTDRTLEKWTTTVSSSLHQMQSLILYHIVPSLERTLIIFEELQVTSLTPGNYQGIPIDEPILRQIISTTTKLTSRIWELTTTISKKVIDFNEFAKFLKYQMSKYAYFNQEEIDEVVSMPKPDFDIMAVIQYLQSGFAMTEIDDFLIKNDYLVPCDKDSDEHVDMDTVLGKAQKNLKEANKLIEGRESNDRRVSGSGLPIRGRHSQGRASEIPRTSSLQADVMSTTTWIVNNLKSLMQGAVDNCDVKLDLQMRARMPSLENVQTFRENVIQTEEGAVYHNIAYSYHLTDEQNDSEIILLKTALEKDSKWQMQRLHLPTTRVVDYGYFDGETLIVLVFDRDNDEHILASVPYHDLAYDGSRIIAPLDKQRTLSKSDEPINELALNGLPGRRIAALSTNAGYGCLVFDMDGDDMESDEEKGDEDEDMEE
ncbi:hypothetical protein E3P88_01328 [Wallemia ichthyophaga]|uniref:U3 small nucleolar RNA-associated protein 10 n=1 Tax=Wallemia ichthyophaga TaxID=245174 RepID=A0A4T0HMP5_WALIC|nr:hypothetical protein E3P90_01373 [Wallemia ichthyophaga]TIB15952.1 hypothetical protein E3P93_01124 [Wallemia ichthyophaga]TIB25906.1 hypothetical protein E3P88_01328 [Wallemia ichthyophaga]